VNTLVRSVFCFGFWLCLRNYSLTEIREGVMHWKMSPRVFLVATYLVLLGALSVLLISCSSGGGGDGGDADPGLIAPAVSQVTPEANSTNIPVMTMVSVELNDVVDTRTITQGTLSVVSSSGAISGTVVYSGNVITFQPETPFDYDNAYTAILSADIESLDGVPLATEYVWEFTTVATGYGDPQNYIPFEQGATWRYDGTITKDGVITSYSNEIRIDGTQVVDGIVTTVFTESNYENTGIPDGSYLYKDLDGVTAYGDLEQNPSLANLFPYQEINFPAFPGYSFVQMHKVGYDFGEDLDSDGINEKGDIFSKVTVVGVETVDTYVDSVLVKLDFQMEVRASRDNTLYATQGHESRWYAPGVGLVKKISETINTDGSTELVTEILSEYLLSEMSVTPATFVQYRTFENALNDRYHAFIDLRKDGDFIQTSDVQSVALYDQNAVQIVPAVPPQFFTAAYTVQPSQDLPFNYHVNFPAQTPLTPVASASMSSQWNPDGSLTLSWSEPPEIFDQYRVAFTDASGEGIFGGRVPTGVSQVTLSASLLEEIRLTGQLTLPTTINWRMQTRNYEGSTNYARSFSDTVTINWP
jgi:hypothetical protein